MKKVIVCLLVAAVLGCAKVNLKTAEPLKFDISMRVDVYQHVVNEVGSIEDMIYGDKEKKLNSISLIPSVYAADPLQEAIDRRRDRASVIEAYFSAGCLGEDRNAYLKDLNGPASVCDQAKVSAVVRAENFDRKIIYQHTADKNGVDISSVEKIVFDDHYKRAPLGYIFESFDSASGQFKWLKK
ncbi:MAG: DUF1318 domain-containing protein [Candidatus Omnitrophica bacterium]|nr:DUF1318 domain-containing protein [Candidatus Omnitrophota bacterium]